MGALLCCQQSRNNSGWTTGHNLRGIIFSCVRTRISLAHRVERGCLTRHAYEKRGIWPFLVYQFVIEPPRR